MVKLPVLLMQLLIFLFLSYIGIIYPLKYDKQYLLSEPFSEYVAVNFGLAVGGVIDISYNVNTSYNDSVSNSYVLLLVINEKQKNNWYGNIGSTSNSNNDQTQIQNKIYNLCTQPSTLRRQLFNSGNFFLEINEELGSDRYSVALLQCKLGNRASPVAATINAELKNPRPKSDGYSQLPIEEVILPRVLGGELILYALLILGSIGQIYYAGVTMMYIPANLTDNLSAYSINLRKIHVLFLISACLTTIATLMEYLEFYNLNKYGKNNYDLEVTVNVFDFLSELSVFMTLLLLSLGWTLVRPALSVKEVKFIVTVTFVWIIFGLGAAVCTDEKEVSCQAMELISFIIRSLILLSSIITMNFTLTQLKSIMYHTPWVPSTPIQHGRAKQYQIFRVIFILYLLLPTAFLLVQVSVLSWRERWVTTALNDLLVIFVLFHVGATFSPLNEQLMTRAFDGSLNPHTVVPRNHLE